MRRGPVRGLLGLLAAVLLVQGIGVRADAQQAAVTIVPGTRALSDVWCRADGSCLAVGRTPEGSGVVAVLHSDGGVGPVRPVPGSRWLYSIACSSAGNCVAIGEGFQDPVVVPIGSDGTPGPARPVSGADHLSRVACPTATTCLATGSVTERVTEYPYYLTWALYVVITNGQPGPPQRFPIEADWILTGIACPSATTCLAVRGRAAVLTDTGGTWAARISSASPPQPPPPAPQGGVTDDLSCGLPSVCYGTAVAFVRTRSGGYWSAPAVGAVTADGGFGPVQPLTNQGGNANGISCAAGTGMCTVVGGLHSGAAFLAEINRGVPVAITYWTNGIGFGGVSCVTGQSCGLVGSNGSNGVFAWKGPPVT